MPNFGDILSIELRKAIRSHMPLWTALGSLFMPCGIAFLLFIARNPAIAANLGLVSAKANLLTYAAMDWPAYLGLTGQIIAVGGFFFFVMAISWVFGREFADGTVKDLLAVPVPRPAILLAKFFVAALWSLALAILIGLACLLMGGLLGLKGGSAALGVAFARQTLVIAGLVIAGVLPFALFASLGRGYLLPLGLAIILVMAANLVVLLGWGEFFPWSVPMLYAQGESVLPALSYWSVILAGLAGVLATILWWQNADQTR